MRKYTGKSIRLGAAAVAIIAALCSPIAASAATTSTNTTINATISSTISMTTSTTVAVGVTPTASGAMSSAFDNVQVTTNSNNGYVLSFADADATTTLVSGANSISADAGTQASPSTTLTNNAWGYRVDGVGGFGAGPTTAETNIASSAFKWAGVPASASPNTLKTTATTALNDQTKVWYGVKVDTTKPSGTYSDTVTYTAVTNS